MSTYEFDEFVSDGMSYIILKGCCCDITVLNIHATAENKTDNVKNNFSTQGMKTYI
jgi:hypothetical protein